MKNLLFRRLTALVLALLMVLPTVAAVYADEPAEDESSSSSVTEGGAIETSAQVLDEMNRASTYSTFYDNHLDDPRPDVEVAIDATQYENASEDSGITTETIDGVSAMVWPNASGSVDFRVSVPESGLYNIQFTYYALSSAANDIELSLLIDGESPYATADRILLSKKWVDSEKSYAIDENGNRAVKTDSHGNQIRPTLAELLTWQTTPLKDTDGLFNDPLRFYFSEGEHVITIESDKARFALSEILLYNEEPTPALADSDPNLVTTDTSKASSTTGINIYLEGEEADYRSDITLYATYDRSTYLTSPSSPTKMLYNTIGSANWKNAGQSVTWKFTTDKAGWVKIGIRGKQNQMRGLYSNRRLYIDGVVPCAEAEAVKFYYSETWQCVTPTDADGNVIYFWVEAGEHELTLEAVPGEIGNIMRRLDDIVYDLNSY